MLGILGSLPMDKGVPPSLFVNDGSFMERFKQLQQEKEKEKGSKLEGSKPIKIQSGSLTANATISRTTNDTRKNPLASSGGKLAFSLKQKSKILAPPVKLGDEDEDETDAAKVLADAPTKRQKLDPADVSKHSSRHVDVGNYRYYNFSFYLVRLLCVFTLPLSLSLSLPTLFVCLSCWLCLGT
jgi:splicing factor 4